MKNSASSHFSKIFFSLSMVLVMIFSTFPVKSAFAENTLPVDVIAPTYPVQTFLSNAGQDGWVLAGSDPNTGASMDATAPTMRVGDDALNRQYRSILSFNTSALPDNAVVISATLKLKQDGITGDDPFTTHGKLLVEIRRSFFGDSPALVPGDFEAKSELTAMGVIAPQPVDGYFTANLYKPALTSVNPIGWTQLRLRFQLPANNNRRADYLSFFSSNAVQKPALEIKYYVPTLPKDLYYVGWPTKGELSHIYRLAKDAKTVTQITHEQSPILYFDISPTDGTIAYALDHQIITVDRDGKNRTVLLEQPENIFSPNWSPDGKTLAYKTAISGLYLYTLATKKSVLLVAGTDNIDESPAPKGFSPDGKKLLISKAQNAPLGAIYDFASKVVTPIAVTENGLPCRGHFIVWATSTSLFCSYPMFPVEVVMPGLWRVDANDGSVTPLIQPLSTALVPLVGAPRQDKNGKLYYLYGEQGNRGGDLRASLSLVSSNIDGITNRVVLRPEKFIINMAIWIPNNGGVILEAEENFKLLGFMLMPLDPLLPVTKLPIDASKIFAPSFRWAP